jgi:hypothetical protein
MAVLIHQFEEYRFPRGFPAAMNIGVDSGPRPDRFPLSSNSSFITNVVLRTASILLQSSSWNTSGTDWRLFYSDSDSFPFMVSISI